ncbi:nucleotidyltransferase family protein [Bacillus cereus]|uniref:nucleotidyltransferase family protein n=1 Tax=Bacillus cereus TaxID=1396 RepID=UPI0018F783E4|nr:nucleotidyltransferase family protein [Bacillus cereus]MBJ8056084.1 nucleotidyltransferase family protein [Bacillus cereus]
MKRNESILFNIATGQQVTEDKINSLNKDIIENRLINPALKNCRNLTIRGEYWGLVDEQFQKKINELKLFIKRLKDEKINYINLKGLAMLKYYPSSIPRQSNDFDFLIKNIEDFWICHKILISLGYSFPYNPMLTKKDGEIVGITKYFKQIDEQTSILIEININSFIISEVSWFGDADLWDKRKKFIYEDLELYIPSDEMNIIILVIESSGRPDFFIRDIVDFYFIYKNTNVNERYIIDKLNDKYLVEVFNNLKSNYISALQGEFKCIKSKVRERREITHVLPNIIKGKNKLTKGYGRYLKLIGEKLINQEGNWGILKQFDKLMSPKRRFDNGVITHFIQFSSVPLDYSWRKYKNFNLLTTPIGIFLATNFAILDEDEEEDIRSYLNRELLK